MEKYRVIIYQNNEPIYITDEIDTKDEAAYIIAVYKCLYLDREKYTYKIETC